MTIPVVSQFEGRFGHWLQLQSLSCREAFVALAALAALVFTFASR